MYILGVVNNTLGVGARKAGIHSRRAFFPTESSVPRGQVKLNIFILTLGNVTDNTATCIKLKNSMLSERIQSQRTTY